MGYEEVVVKCLNAWKENNDFEIGGSTRVTTHIFAVYDGNTDKLGLLNPDDAEKIVTAYTLAKGHAESLALVAEALKDFGLQLRTFDAMGHASHVSGMRNSIIAVPRLKDESGALLKAFAEAMTAVNNYAPPPAALTQILVLRTANLRTYLLIHGSKTLRTTSNGFEQRIKKQASRLCKIRNS